MHRLLQHARRVQHRDIFGIAPALHAEGAAEIVGEDAQLLRLDAHGAGDLAAHGGDALRAAAKRELLGAGVVARGRRARLERGDHQALIDQFDAHHMGGILEGAIERRLFLALGIGGRAPVETDIAGRFRPELRRAGRDRRTHVGHGVERLVIDRDFFAGVLRLGGAGRDYHRHRLTDMQHALIRQRRPKRRDRYFPAAAWNRMRMRDGMIMRRGQVGGGQHRRYARRALGSRDVDVFDGGESVRRAHEIGRQGAFRLDVVAEAATSAQQRVILDTAGPFGWAGLASGSRFHCGTPAE